MEANIYHLIKGYDLLTVELVLMARKAEFLKLLLQAGSQTGQKFPV